jgi:hypothetical protein
MIPVERCDEEDDPPEFARTKYHVAEKAAR